ncbi:MAG: riboflavin biosynthesis protein RibF [Conexibacter sp.]|nr:riboflavin biosynthesis protein RibF [Conexibacter sp.]
MSPAQRGWHAGSRIVIERLEAVRPRPRRVAIGNFDGVHLGHQAIVRGCDTVLTFAPHPLAVLAPDRAPALLGTLAARAAQLAALGVRELVVLPFDRAFARQSPDEFVERVLCERLGATHVSVGANFRYGARAAGDVRSLAACPHFTTSAAPLVEVAGEVVSSTRIRNALFAGEVELATRLLGRPHRASCRVAGRAGARDAPITHVHWNAEFVFPRIGWYTCRVHASERGRAPDDAYLRIDARPTGAADAAATARLIGCGRGLPGEELTVELLARELHVPRLVAPARFVSHEGLHASA